LNSNSQLSRTWLVLWIPRVGRDQVRRAGTLRALVCWASEEAAGLGGRCGSTSGGESQPENMINLIGLPNVALDAAGSCRSEMLNARTGVPLQGENCTVAVWVRGRRFRSAPGYDGAGLRPEMSGIAFCCVGGFAGFIRPEGPSTRDSRGHRPRNLSNACLSSPDNMINWFARRRARRRRTMPI
jgi:hypothetical protein